MPLSVDKGTCRPDRRQTGTLADLSKASAAGISACYRRLGHSTGIGLQGFGRPEKGHWAFSQATHVASITKTETVASSYDMKVSVL